MGFKSHYCWLYHVISPLDPHLKNQPRFSIYFPYISNAHRQCVHLTALNVGSDHAQRHAIGHAPSGKGLQADLAVEDLWKLRCTLIKSS